MDAEKRHQLKSNELAEALEKMRHLNDPKMLISLAAIGAVVVVLLGFYAWRQSQVRVVEDQWQRLVTSVMAANSGEDAQSLPAMDELRQMAQEASNPAISGYARVMLAVARVDQALMHPQEREQALAEARDALEPLASDTTIPAALQAAATFSLASTYESLRAFNQARANYQKLIQDPRFAPFGYRKLAEQRLADLNRIEVTVNFQPGMPPPGSPAATAQSGAPPTIDEETARRIIAGKQSPESILPQTQPAPGGQPASGGPPQSGGPPASGGPPQSGGQPAPEAPAAPPPAPSDRSAPAVPPADTQPGQGGAPAQTP